MEGILILAHGSKKQETERILNSLVDKVVKKSGEKLVYPAYLQFSEQNIERGIDYLVGKGAKTVKVVPMFLFDGVHVTEDIPNELSEIGKMYPEIEIKMADYIGDDDRIADIIIDRFRSV